MPKPLRKLGFLTIGLFDEDDPRRGHESTLEIISLGEQLGFDSAWVRHRHVQILTDTAEKPGPALGWSGSQQTVDHAADPAHGVRVAKA